MEVAALPVRVERIPEMTCLALRKGFDGLANVAFAIDEICHLIDDHINTANNEYAEKTIASSDILQLSHNLDQERLSPRTTKPPSLCEK